MEATKPPGAGPKGIELPTIVFWDETAPSLAFINEDDFRPDQYLAALGLQNHPLRKSFPTKSCQEISRRQRIIRFLIGEGDSFQAAAGRLLIACQLTSDPDGFVRYFRAQPLGKKCFFWENLDEFLTASRSYLRGTLPPEISEFLEFLADTREAAEQREKTWADKVIAELAKAYVVEGVATFSLSCTGRRYLTAEMTSSQVFGYLCHSVENVQFQPEEIPDWAQKHRLLGWRERRTVTRRNSTRRAELLEPKVISQMPEALYRAITRSIDKALEPIGIPDIFERVSGTMQVHFAFSAAGLRLRFLNASQGDPENQPAFAPRYSVIDLDYQGLTPAQQKQALRLSVWVDKQVYEAQRNRRLDEFCARAWGVLDRAEIFVKEPLLMEAFKNFSIAKICEDPALKDDYQAVRAYRQFVADHLLTLEQMWQIADAFRKNPWGFSFCYPCLLSDDKHLVSFGNLLPVHLIGRKAAEGRVIGPRELIPIRSLGDLNGQILGLTGPNGGGKTVTEEAILYAIYSAQCGFPVFGQGFALNVKDALGAAFVERGSGSACELMFVKLKRILEALKTLTPSKVVLVVDELGGLTQEDSGFGIGLRFLQTVAKHGGSTVFSTQITELAKAAVAKLGATCYQVGIDRQIRNGIGRGEAEKLAVRVGLDKLLEPASTDQA